jgi:hypothetical protein
MRQHIKTFYFPLFLLCSILFITACSKKKTDEPKPVMGTTYHGGIVFYIDNTGLHGLVAATADLGTGSSWGCYGSAVAGADGTAMGTGNQNTIDIAKGCAEAGTAAKVCSDYVSGGFSDWYLPSKDELNLMFQQKNAIGGFRLDSYWSSSEFSANQAWLQSFNTGVAYSTNKDYGTNVRPVRAF